MDDRNRRRLLAADGFNLSRAALCQTHPVPALSRGGRSTSRSSRPAPTSDTVLAIGSDLVRRLGENHRHYHTTRHLVEVFWALEDLEGGNVISAREAALGRVAGWFHDAVYDTTTAAGDNEMHSADLAVRAPQCARLRARRRRHGPRPRPRDPVP